MDRVTVRRFRVDCAVPRDHPNPAAVRGRIDDAAARLSTALGELLAPLAKLGDEVIVLKRLELTLDLDTSCPPDEIARAWAARLAAAIATALSSQAHGPVLRFSDETHYLARFLVDAAMGSATERWYYRRWQGLWSLAVSAQLRTALVEDPMRGLAALAVLSSTELARVLTALGPSDARRVVEAILADGERGDLETAAAALQAHVPAWLQHAHAVVSPWQAALALAVTATQLPPAELRAALALAAALAAARPSSSTLSPGARAMRDLDLPSPASLLALSTETRRALLAVVAPSAPDPMPVAGRYTRLGGLVLLLPRLAELPLADVFGEGAGRARLEILARAAGAARRAEVLADPLWHRLCGVSTEDLDGTPLAPALWRSGVERARRLRVTVTRHGVPMLVVASEPDGAWLSATVLTPALRAALRGSRACELDGIELFADVSRGAARTAAQMLAWIAPALEDSSDLAFGIAAQHVLRAFARRLPGFADSSPQFLFDSFLDFDATIVERADMFHCRVGRPRLAAVFGLTGALRGRLRLADGLSIELYPEGA